MKLPSQTPFNGHKAVLTSEPRQALSSAHEIDLGRIAAILTERLTALILCILLSLAAAVAYIKIAPRTYEASSTLEIYVRRPRIMGDHEVASERIDTGKSSEAFNTQLEKIQGAELRDLMALALSATNAPGLPERSREEWDQYLEQHIRFAPVPGTFLISITAKTPTPEHSAYLANTYALAAADHTREVTRRHSMAAVRWLEEQVESYKEKLKEAESKEMELKLKANTESVGKQKLTSDAAIDDISRELVLLQSKTTRLTELSDRIDAASTNINKSVIMPSDIPRADIIQERYQDYLNTQKTMSALKEKYTDKHPSVQAARRNLETNRNELLDEMTRARNTVSEDLRLTSAYVGSMKQKKLEQISISEQLQGRIDEFHSRSLPLKREIESLNNSFQGLLKRITESQLAADETASQVEIASKARPPQGHSSPNTFMVLLLALVTGPMTGMVLVMTLHLLQNRIVSLADVEIGIGTRVLGVIPTVTGGDAAPCMGRVLLDNPSSIASEALSGIRSSLISKHSDDPGGAWCIAIVSTFPEEGKTTGACNLAISMSQTHDRVLLIDGDFRRPSIHTVFPDAKPAQPLAACLTEAIGSNAFDTVVSPTDVDGLDVTSAACERTFLPPEHLESPRFEAFMSWAATWYDVVVIDTPPMGPVHDAMIFCRYADDVLVMSHCKRSRKSALQRALQLLERNGSPASGVILNGYQSGHLSTSGGRYGQYGYKKYERSS